MKKSLMLLTMLVSISLAACGGSGGGSTTATSLAMKGISGNAVDMNGTWSLCTHSTDGYDELIQHTLNGSSLNMKLSQWVASTPANCTQTTAADLVITVSASVALGPDATATWTNGGGSTQPPTGVSTTAKATQVTGLLNSATMTPASAIAANYHNSVATCGYTDWAVGVTKNILNCTELLGDTTQPDYWVVDDSAAILKWYSSDNNGPAYQVNSTNPLTK